MDKYIKENPKKVFATKGQDILKRNAKIVNAGRADFLIEDLVLVDFENGEKKYNIVKKGCLENRSFAYPGFQSVNKKRSKILAAAFDKGFEKILKDGTINKIVGKYNLSLDTWSAGKHK